MYMIHRNMYVSHRNMYMIHRNMYMILVDAYVCPDPCVHQVVCAYPFGRTAYACVCASCMPTCTCSKSRDGAHT